MKKRVLIVCTGNACRSQMAEGFWRQLGQDRWEVFSAGSQPAGYVHPLAIDVMKEVGVDISTHRCKHVNELAAQSFDLVVTVCDRAKESCPTRPGAGQTLHWAFDDPASASGPAKHVLMTFRRVRDQIRDRIARYLRERGLAWNGRGPAGGP